jgi:tetratricopeptide (TPR) repeat protein
MSALSKNVAQQQVIALRAQLAAMWSSAGQLAQQNDLETLVAQFMQSIFEPVDAGNYYRSLNEEIQTSIEGARLLQAILEQILRQVETLEAEQPQYEGYSEQWWSNTQKELRGAFETDPMAGVKQWLQIYAELLLNWRLDLCDRLVRESWPFPPDAAHLPAIFKDGTKALQTLSSVEANVSTTVSRSNTPWQSSRADRSPERTISRDNALEMVRHLTDLTNLNETKSLLDHRSGSLLQILAGRIYLQSNENQEAALMCFEQARKLAPAEGYTLAALGDYYRAKGDRDKAGELYQQAIDLQPNQPEGYNGLGLWSEDQELWDEANDWYEQGIKLLLQQRDINDPDAILRRLLAPVSANLYLQLADALKQDGRNPESALKALERSLQLGIRRAGVYHERVAYQLKGDLLELLEHPDEAAQAFFEAGKQWEVESDLPLVIELLQRAIRLDPTQAAYYWPLADALRARSIRPEPQLVDAQPALEAMQIWNQGVQLKKVPDTDDWWVYLVGALIREQIAYIPKYYPNRQHCWWEAIAYLERAILLSNSQIHIWINLSKYHYDLTNYAVAHDVIRSASENAYEKEEQILEQKLVIVANQGYYAEANELLSELRSLPLDNLYSHWADATTAWVMLYTEDYTGAVDLLRAGIEEEPDKVWYRETRAYLYDCLAQKELAQADWRYLYEHIRPEHVTQQLVFARAAFYIGAVDEAIVVYNKQMIDPLNEGEARRDLGVIYLTQGKLEDGEAELRHGIELATRPQQIDDLLMMRLRSLRLSVVTAPIDDPSRLLLDRIDKLGAARRKALEVRREPLSELSEIVQQFKRDGKSSLWTWVGASAGLARLLVEEKKWHEALLVYQLFYKETLKEFPEATIGVRNCLEGLQKDADKQLKEGNLVESANIYSEMLTVTKDVLSDDHRRQANIHSRLAYCHCLQGHNDDAGSHIRTAFELYRAASEGDPGAALGSIVRSLLPDVPSYWTLVTEWQALAREPDTIEALRHDLDTAVKTIEPYLDERFELNKGNDLTIPVATQIVFEVPDNLVPKVDSRQDGGRFLYELIPAMRDRIISSMGVRVPGVRARGRKSSKKILAPNEYRILLDESLVVDGTAYLDHHFYLAPSDQLQALGVPVAAIVPATNPLTGGPGCWVQAEDSTFGANHGLERWTEAEFMIYHIEAVLRQHLEQFVGIQEVETILDTWSQGKRYDVIEADPARGTSAEQQELAASRKALLQAVLPDQDARFHFTRILRSLVAERVPITKMESMLTALEGITLNPTTIQRAVQAVRLALKPLLPGNALHDRQIELPSPLEETLAAGMVSVDGQIHFNVQPTELSRVLAAIAESVPAGTHNVVLVSHSAELRPLVRRVVERKFPHLMVLSHNERLSPHQI